MEFDINKLTVGQLKEIAGVADCLKPKEGKQQFFDAYPYPWELGKIYLIRTVTMIDTGRLLAVTPQELVLEEAAWIADTGRFSTAVEQAVFGEVEPFPEGRVIIGRGSIIDAVQIKLAPRSLK